MRQCWAVVCRSDEPGGASISTYPREIEGLARKQESKRKRQREARKERATAAERDRTAELKRLKNLKVSEMKQTCGPGALPDVVVHARVWRAG